jgi:Flp pilus assembly secretin CpaC
MSGAGTVAYHFCRLVCVPEYNMWFKSLRGRSRVSVIGLSLAAAVLLCPLVALAEVTSDPISVNVDQAKLVKLPGHIATIVVGNPLIADVTMQPGGLVVVTGKGYGATNVIAMDRAGSILVDRVIQVEGPSDQVVTVYRGVERESYSCMPVCQKRITLGDGAAYFKATMGQASDLSSQASGGGAK